MAPVRRSAAVIAACAVIAMARGAMAQGPDAQGSRTDDAGDTRGDTRPEVSAPSQVTWYGYQILALDLASVGAFAWASGNDGPSGASEGAAVFALATYLADGAVVHALHGHSTRAAVSTCLRVVAPVVGALLGAAATSKSASQVSCSVAGCDGGDPTPRHAIVGFFVGAIGAMVVDDVVPVWEEPSSAKENDGDGGGDEAPETPKKHVRDPQEWSRMLTPRVALTRDAGGRATASVGVSGGF